MLHDLTIFKTPNGQSLKWWKGDRDTIEAGDYFDFVENWWVDMCIGKVRFFESEARPWPLTSDFVNDKRRCINAIVEAWYTARRKWSDEELIRYQKEVSTAPSVQLNAMSRTAVANYSVTGLESQCLERHRGLSAENGGAATHQG